MALLAKHRQADEYREEEIPQGKLHARLSTLVGVLLVEP
jgi:hypothetical protein